MAVLAWIVTGVLGAFTLRRYLYGLASWLPRRPHAPSRTRSIVVLVAARNEERGLPRLLAALDQLDYPAEKLNFVLVSDGSTDQTADIIRQWAGRQPRAQALILPESLGKGAALRAGMTLAPAADLVAVVDADTVPRPDALAHLAGAFDDPKVGAACGYPDPGLDHRSVVARYAALERWAMHLVTMAGKDRLGAHPSTIGAFCAFRAGALAHIGGFASGSLVEDIEVSMALTRRGWKLRWIGEAVAREDVPTDLDGFRLQRLRWSRGLMASAGQARNLEDLMVAAGYLDRLVFAAGVVLALIGRGPIWAPIAYAAAPVATVLTAVWRARAPRKIAYLAAIPPMVLADLAVTVESAVPALSRTRRGWRAGARAHPDQTTTEEVP